MLSCPYIIAIVFTFICAYVIARKAKSKRRLSPDGKAVLVTGCDTPLGFGTAIARHLHELGYAVFAGCLDAKTARENLYTEFEQTQTFTVLQLDVTDQLQVGDCVRSVENWLKDNPEYHFHGLVNNAGIFEWSPIEWLSVESFIKVFDVNCFGIIRVTKAFLPLLRKGSTDGRVVNIASIAADLPSPYAVPYSSSKSAAVAISQAVGMEVAQFGVKFSVVCPDFFRTNILTDIDRNAAKIKTTAGNTKPEVFEAYGGDKLVAFLTKQMTINVPKLAQTDLSPVVENVVDGLASPTPKIKYTPIVWRMRLAVLLQRLSPSHYIRIRRRMLKLGE